MTKNKFNGLDPGKEIIRKSGLTPEDIANMVSEWDEEEEEEE